MVYLFGFIIGYSCGYFLPAPNFKNYALTISLIIFLICINEFFSKRRYKREVPSMLGRYETFNHPNSN